MSTPQSRTSFQHFQSDEPSAKSNREISNIIVSGVDQGMSGTFLLEHDSTLFPSSVKRTPVKTGMGQNFLPAVLGRGK